jgi:hypothetical protein
MRTAALLVHNSLPLATVLLGVLSTSNKTFIVQKASIVAHWAFKDVRSQELTANDVTALHDRDLWMSLDNCSVVDAVGIDADTRNLILTIVDSWDWADERAHLAAPQEKINGYFSFIESGQIYDVYPDAMGRNLVLDIVARYSIPELGLEFLNKAAVAATAIGLAITHRCVA